MGPHLAMAWRRAAEQRRRLCVAIVNVNAPMARPCTHPPTHPPTPRVVQVALLGGNISSQRPGDPANIFNYSGPRGIKVRSGV